MWQGIRARDLTPQELFRISRERNSAYHTPADTVSASWNGDAIRQHLDLLHRVGLELANAARPVHALAADWAAVGSATMLENGMPSAAIGLGHS